MPRISKKKEKGKWKKEPTSDNKGGEISFERIIYGTFAKKREFFVLQQRQHKQYGHDRAEKPTDRASLAAARL